MTKMLIVKKKIVECFDCHFHGYQISRAYPNNTVDFCTYFNTDTLFIDNPSSIPSWCPLEDATENKFVAVDMTEE